MADLRKWPVGGYWLPLLVLLLVILTYSNHFQNDFVFDDLHAVMDNIYIRDWRNIPRMLWDAKMLTPLVVNRSYRPFLPISFAVDYALGGGLYPFFFHLTTFLAFLLQLVCMALLVERLVGDRRRAWLGVAVYGLHPVATQTVNYICQRSEVYVSLGLCLGMYLYIRGRTGWAMLAFTMGSLFKQNGVVFCGLICSYEFFLGGRHWRKLLPFVLLTLGLLATMAYLSPPHMDLGGGNPYFYWITEPYVMLLYVKAFFMPSALIGDTDMQPFHSILEPKVLLGFFGLFCWVVAMFRLGSVPGFAMSWFLVAQAPTVLVPFSDVTNDHRMYGPYVAAAILTAYLARTSQRQWPVAVFLPLLGIASFQRNAVWHTRESFWREVVLKCPTNGRAWMNYALCQVELDRDEEAFDSLIRAQDTTSGTYSPLFLNFGLLYGKLGNIRAAESNFKRATEVDKGSTPWYVYGDWLVSQQRWGEAAVVLRRALNLNPGDPRPLFSLRRGWADALRVAHQKKTALAYIQVAMLLYVEGRYEQALESAEYASELEPKNPNPYVNQAACLLALKRWKEAEKASLRALELDSGSKGAKENLRLSRLHLGGMKK